MIVLLLFLLSSVEMCSDNCMAYKTTVNYIAPYYQYNIFYLPYKTSNGCKQCYFDVSAYNPSGNYIFWLGLLNNNDFSVAVDGDVTASSGFSSCYPGYCAVKFNKGFSYFSIQMSESQSRDGCYFNNSFCTGTIDSKASYGNFYPSISMLNCLLYYSPTTTPTPTPGASSM